jgi:hypothetical protein
LAGNTNKKKTTEQKDKQTETVVTQSDAAGANQQSVSFQPRFGIALSDEDENLSSGEELITVDSRDVITKDSRDVIVGRTLTDEVITEDSRDVIEGGSNNVLKVVLNLHLYWNYILLNKGLQIELFLKAIPYVLLTTF